MSCSCHPPSDTAVTNAYTHLSYISFTNNSITVHWETNVTDSYTFYSTLQKH